MQVVLADIRVRMGRRRTVMRPALGVEETGVVENRNEAMK
jgi:hypothetical protein